MKALIIGTAALLFVGILGSALHYKKQAENTALLLTKQTELVQEQKTAILHYKAYSQQLLEKLKQQQKQAEYRRQQLKDALNREKNQSWKNELVPNDVAGVLNNAA